MKTIQYLTTRYCHTAAELLECINTYKSEEKMWLQFSNDESVTKVKIFRTV